jgi:hypothetical protein
MVYPSQVGNSFYIYILHELCISPPDTRLLQYDTVMALKHTESIYSSKTPAPNQTRHINTTSWLPHVPLAQHTLHIIPVSKKLIPCTQCAGIEASHRLRGNICNNIARHITMHMCIVYSIQLSRFLDFICYPIYT